MRIFRPARWLTALILPVLMTASFNASPEDIDIFSVDEGTNLDAPNVLIVLDNTANWARQSQNWPGGEDQGQSEVAAIKQVILELDQGINVGLMEYVTGGSATDTDFGYIRSHIRPMTAGNRSILAGHMDRIYANINAPEEKRGSSNPYGNLMWDVYNYLSGGNQANGGAGTPSALADSQGYDTNYSNFATPLTANDDCTRTIVIFIGNNTNGTITPDSTANVDALRALAGGGAAGDAAVAQIKHADYTVETTTATSPLGYTNSCFASAAACNTAVSAAAVCSEEGFTSCFCDTSDTVACPSSHWSVVARTTSAGTPELVSDTTTNTPNQWPGHSQDCSKNEPNANGCTFPSQTTLTYNNQNCPNGLSSCTAASGHTSTITTSYDGACTFVNTNTTSSTCSAPKTIWRPTGNRIERSVVRRQTTSTTVTPAGTTNACYNDLGSCVPGDITPACPAGATCSCTAPANTTGCGPGTTARYMAKGNYNVTEATQTGTFSAAPPGPYMMDEWARFMRQAGVLVPGLSARNQVTTYVIDVFNAQQSAELSGLWFNTARVGGGKYFQAKDKNAILNALRDIFTEVQAVNSAFSSASLPINATNRTQNENQVFIGVFKPDRDKDALWFGNLKRFQIVADGADLNLGDSMGNPAINNQTGFLSDCAVSFWTTDSGTYWNSVITDDPDALGICSTNSTSDYSDLPDGPFVEKGAAAEVLRKGNSPGAAADGSGNFVLTRSVKTLADGALVDFSTTVYDDPENVDQTQENLVVNFIRGADADDYDDNDGNLTEPRSTIHGDVVHSRPQPVNYGGGTGIIIYYGSNDGAFRAVQASTGQELWSFIAPEHYSKLRRLVFSGKSSASAKIKLFGDSTGLPKDYFFDGSTGLFQSFSSSNTTTRAWIFPSMRRGGRKVYAFNVTSPAAPAYLWSRGCPNLTNDTGCDADWAGIGQTWSIPRPMFIKGYSETRPVVVFGGGYDRCDDENSASPCAATKGRGVYVVDAEDGSLVRHFDFSTLSGVSARGVAADVAPISLNNDSFVDYLYAVDTGGNVYRMDFVDTPTTYTPLAKASWRYSRVAYTNGSGRKFLFQPSVLQNGPNTVYLAVGTGDREHPLMTQYPYGLSPETAVKNRFYVFKDLVTDVDATTQLNLDDTNPPNNMVNHTTDQGCSAENVTVGSAKRGWFMELTANGRGEQVVTSSVVAGGFINFSTNRPTPPDASACSSSLGEARGYFVNLLNASGAIGVEGDCGGTRSSPFIGGGLPPSPVIATTQVGDRIETVIIGAVPKEGGSGSALEANKVTLNLDSRRRPVYWYKTSGED